MKRLLILVILTISLGCILEPIPEELEPIVGDWRAVNKESGLQIGLFSLYKAGTATIGGEKYYGVSGEDHNEYWDSYYFGMLNEYYKDSRRSEYEYFVIDNGYKASTGDRGIAREYYFDMVDTNTIEGTRYASGVFYDEIEIDEFIGYRQTTN